MAETKDQKLDKVKIALIGSTGVGKTCIIKRFAEDTYDEGGISTIGGAYYQKTMTINGKQIQIDLWDTAGQEQYRSLTRHFYKDAYIVCLVYDITKENTFEDLKNVWYNELKANGTKYNILAVVGNKSDDFENEKIREETAREYAEQINAVYFLTSAKTGDGINALFETVVSRYLAPQFQPKIKEMENEKGEKGIELTKDNKNSKNKKKCC